MAPAIHPYRPAPPLRQVVKRYRRAQARENFRQRLTGDKRRLLRGNPSASSGRYGQQLALLRQRLAEERQERKKRKK